MTTGSLFASPPDQHLLLWVVGSTVCYALATLGLALGLRRTGPQSRLQALVRSPGGLFAGWFLWMIWLVGPGYAALVTGQLSPRLMGLSQIDLGAGLGFGTLFAVFALIVLLAAGLTYRRLRYTDSLGAPYPTPGIAISAGVRLIVEAGALQWHWAFYRSAIIVALAGAGLPDPLYWGSWLAVAWICLEGALSPLLWSDLRHSGKAEIRILRGVLLVATTVVYLMSRNFWLAWALHSLTTVLLEARLSAAPRAHAERP
jgi:hypothetical protein